MRSNRWWSVGLVAGTVVITLLVQAAIANPATTVSGRQITAVKVVREATPLSIGDINWQDLPGATTTITIPSNTQGLILARFSAPMRCNGDVGGRCLIRILIGGVEAAPALGDNSIFATPGDGSAAHSMDRSRGPLGPGTYSVVVQYRVFPAPPCGCSLSFEGWHLTVERVRV